MSDFDFVSLQCRENAVLSAVKRRFPAYIAMYFTTEYTESHKWQIINEKVVKPRRDINLKKHEKEKMKQSNESVIKVLSAIATTFRVT